MASNHFISQINNLLIFDLPHRAIVRKTELASIKCHSTNENHVIFVQFFGIFVYIRANCLMSNLANEIMIAKLNGSLWCASVWQYSDEKWQFSASIQMISANFGIFLLLLVEFNQMPKS